MPLQLFDCISGICKAVAEGKIFGAIGFKGIVRKVIMFSLVGIAHLIDQFLPGEKDAFRIAIILFYIGNEGISIIENAEKKMNMVNYRMYTCIQYG